MKIHLFVSSAGAFLSYLNDFEKSEPSRLYSANIVFAKAVLTPPGWWRHHES